MRSYGIPTPPDEVHEPVDATEDNPLGRPLDADPSEAEAETEDEHESKHSRSRAAKK